MTRPAGLLREAWRRLRTMKTAIILLFVLAASSSIGSLIPQRPVNELAVARWKLNHAAWAPVAERLGLFDVYGSWWFTAVYALLLVSVAGCLVPRYRAFFRAVRSRPRSRTSLAEFRNFRYGVTKLDPNDALTRAAGVLRKRRYRLVRENGSIGGEKGHLREGGSLLFHSAFFVLIVGIALARGFGLDGQAAIIEGDEFTETHVGYDSIKEGRFFGERHRGFSVRLDRFDVSWHPNGVPADFVSNVTILEDERVVERRRIRVNEPISYRGVTLYQLAWGWAPQLQVLKDGEVRSDANVIFLQDSRTENWRGVVKVPSLRPQLGLELYFFNDLRLVSGNTPINASPYPRRPFLFFQEYRGDLGLDLPQSIYRLEKTRLAQGEVGGIALGGKHSLGDGVELRFVGLKKYSVLQMNANPGAWVLFAAAVLILVGLLPALYSSRRRVWVRAVPSGDATRIEVAGQALQRKHAFEDEFRALVRELGRDMNVEQPGARTGSRVESGIDAG